MLLVAVLAALTAATGQFETHLRAGVAALDANRPADAEIELDLAVRARPESAGAWLLLAQARAKQNKRDVALAAAAKAEVLGPGDPDILKGLAHFYTATIPDPSRAAGIILRYAEKRPQDKAAWQAAAALQLQLGNPQQAIAIGARGLAVAGDNAALHATMGRAFTELHDWNSAAKELRHAVTIDPYDEETQFRLAQVYLLRQDFASAAEVLLNARKIFAASPQIELALGVAWYGQRKFTESVDQFLRTMRLDPDLPQPYVFLTRILDHAGDRLPEVISRCSEFEKRNPDSYLGYLLHAKALSLTDPEDALTLVQKSLALEENNAEAHYLLGTLLERKGELNEAAAHLERSIALNAKEAAPHFRLARVYMRLGRKEEAAQHRALHEKLSAETDTAGVAHSP